MSLLLLLIEFEGMVWSDVLFGILFGVLFLMLIYFEIICVRVFVLFLWNFELEDVWDVGLWRELLFMVRVDLFDIVILLLIM